ncbi:MAG: hypothetical protein IJP48_03275 [Synergistaceae bacterium]|nr:hypothetical protein [Synergistaceae bacterium]
MVDLGFIARVKNYALKNGLNPADYDERTLARRERDALKKSCRILATLVVS